MDLKKTLKEEAMHPSRKFSIEEVGERLVEALKTLGWKVVVETDEPRRFKEYFASKRPEILEAFVRIQILLYALEEDPNFVDAIFIFYADPNITGKGKAKVPFGKKARANEAEVFRNFCQEVFDLAGLEMEFDGWDIEPTSRCVFNFKGTEPPEYQKAGYTLTLFYLKKPIEKSVDGLLAKKDRELLFNEFFKEAEDLGFEVSWKSPFTGEDLYGICFYVDIPFLEVIPKVLKYKYVKIKIDVKFDRIEVFFWLEAPELNTSFSDKLKVEDMAKFLLLMQKFPELNTEIDEETLEMNISGIFPFSKKEKISKFLKELKENFLS